MKRSIILVAAAAATLGTAPAASGAVKLADGQTRLTIAKSTAGALSHLGVAVSPTGPARAAGRHVRFPITGGKIDPATAAGKIKHRGGLRLKAGKTKVVLDNYTVNVGRKITLSARLGKSRVTILNLTGTPKVTRDGFGTNVSGLTAKLNRTAARALNGAFGVTAFKNGLTLGKVKAQAVLSQTQLLAEGATAPAHRPGTLQALASLGISPNVIGPATLAGTTAPFPIMGGKAELDLSAETVRHSGGIR